MWLHLEILLTGVAVVLGVLALLWGTAALLGLGFKLAERRHMAAAEPASSGQAGSPDPPRHHLAPIVAAVAHALERPHHIVELSVPGHTMPSWSRDSRFRHPSSQRVRWDIYANSPPAKP
jgi:Na+-transporting methylmalonyl-CoA/oxaloacetate decarboxylase gamma subunit